MGKECVIPPITFPKSVLIGGFVGLMESIMWICFALCFLTLEKAKGLVESEDSDKFWRYFFNNLHAEEGDRDMMIHYVMLVYLIVSTIWGLLSIFMLIQRGRHVPPCCTYKWVNIVVSYVRENNRFVCKSSQFLYIRTNILIRTICVMNYVLWWKNLSSLSH